MPRRRAIVTMLAGIAIAACAAAAGYAARGSSKLAAGEIVSALPTSRHDSAIVYVTRSGSKYHAAGCQYLRTGGTAIELSRAKQRYAPCSRCQPPR